MIAIAPRQQANWDWRAAGNFVLGGTGAGLMAMVASAVVYGAPYPPDAVFVALAFVGAGLFLVLLEIGRPMRFLNVFRHPQTSWMSREAIAAVLFFGAGVVGWLFALEPMVVAAAVFGLIFLLCQAKMLQASRGIPTWREGAIVPLVAATGLVEGAGLLVLLSIVTIGAVQYWLASTLLDLLVLRTIVVLFYAWRLRGPSSPNVVKPGLRRVVWLVAGLGGIVPVMLLLAPPELQQASLLPIAAALALATGWGLKYIIVCQLGAMQGFAIKHTPARGGAAPGTSAKPGWLG
jgi:phenylacetyl-CoA:acceptor oxidoreductase 26-kDa subunit